jgi:hypothetical protein
VSEHTIRKCDECDALRTVVNHWWCVIADPTRPTFMTFLATEELLKAGRLPADGVRLDYCSHKCVGTAFHRWLDTGDVRKVLPSAVDDKETEQ